MADAKNPIENPAKMIKSRYRGKNGLIPNDALAISVKYVRGESIETAFPQDGSS